MTDTSSAEALRQAQICAELDDEERETLAARMGREHLEDRALLVREGEERRTLFILVKGQIDVSKSVGPHEETVYRMHPGEAAGTRAFLDGSPRKAALRAYGDTEVLTMEPDAFEALVESHPWLVYKIMRGIFRVTHGNLMRMNLESAELRNYMLRTGGLY
jgi:CRP-like cAMP-binding protein